MSERILGMAMGACLTGLFIAVLFMLAGCAVTRPVERVRGESTIDPACACAGIRTTFEPPERYVHFSYSDSLHPQRGVRAHPVKSDG